MKTVFEVINHILVMFLLVFIILRLVGFNSAVVSNKGDKPVCVVVNTATNALVSCWNNEDFYNVQE